MENKWERSCRSRKKKYFFYFECMNDIIKTMKSLEESSLLIDGVTETVKHKIKNRKGRFLEALLA